MSEPISGIQNQNIFLRVSHESSHILSIQQYASQAALLSSAQNVEKKREREMNAPKNIEQTQEKKTQSSTEGRSQGEYYQRKSTKQNTKKDVKSDSSHILDVRV
ncbi:MAG: hypothetical protein ACK4MM_01655 [Fervidobacterium sp.]